MHCVFFVVSIFLPKNSTNTHTHTHHISLLFLYSSYLELCVSCPFTVRGLLLYGKPGCGKTLLARTLGSILSPMRPITVVSGPEIMDKFVGSSEKVRRTSQNDYSQFVAHLTCSCLPANFPRTFLPSIATILM